jgi:outer membrane protein OmpA-like peptidoglycan-associated protein
LKDLVRSSYAELELNELLKKPPSVLLGVSPTAGAALAKVGIKTVFDLGTSNLFAAARTAVTMKNIGTPTQRFGMVSGDLLDGSIEHSLDEISNLSIEKLRVITAQQASELAAALDIVTIKDMAQWPPYLAARKIVGDSVGATTDLEDLHSEELRPRLGEYPTERVYYSTLVMLQMLGDPGQQPQELAGAISLDPTVQAGNVFNRLAIGAILSFSQSWYSQGITLGHMLHSLALAPGEATRLAVIDWSRRTSAMASEAITESERLDNSTLHARALSEVQQATADDVQAGGSMSTAYSSSSSRSSGSAGGTGFFASLFGSSSSSSTSQSASSFTMAASEGWSIGSRSALASMAQNVNDRTEQHSASVRNRRATAVREVSQSEHEQVSTRIVANYNHMHALTIQYYEVIQVYRVLTELYRAERCLFLPLQLLDFSAPNGMKVVERFKAPLLLAALNNRIRSLLIDDTTAVEIKPSATVKFGALTPELLTITPKVMQDLIVRTATSVSAIKTTLTATSSSVQTNIAAASVGNTGGGGGGTTQPKPTPSPAVESVRIWDDVSVAVASRIVDRPLVRPGSNSIYVPDNVELISISFENSFAGQMLTVDAAGRSDSLTIPSDIARVDFPMPVRLVEILSMSISKSKTADLDGSMTFYCSYLGRRFALPAIPLFLRKDTNPQGAASKQIVVTFQNDRPDRQKELLQHLQNNREYYSQAIFRSLDSATLTSILSQYKWNGKPLIDQVEPRPLRVTGNYLILRAPVDDDQPSGIMEDGKQLTWDEVRKKRGFDKQTNPRLIPIPTGGVFAEAVLGRSNSAEKLDITRFWHWQDSPIPLSPPEIAPVQAVSRATADDLKPGQLSAPVLNLLNPTPLPAPDSISAILNALSNLNFRDMSGLALTQALAKAGMEGTLQAATSAGQLASENMKTEAQKVVAMGQIAADVAKTAIGAKYGKASQSGGNNVSGISGDGARINHGRSMDQRGISGPSGSGLSPSGNSNSSTSNVRNNDNETGDGDTSGTSGINSSGIEAVNYDRNAKSSREVAYADQGAFGYSPDAVGAVSVSTTGAAGAGSTSGSGSASKAPAQPPGYLMERLRRSRELIDAGEEGIEVRGSDVKGRILISNFDIDSNALKTEFFGALDQIALMMNASTRSKLLIEGRASQTGRDAYNLELSQRRAESVYDWLVGVGGVSREKIVDVIGVGWADPIVDRRGLEEPLNRSVLLIFSIPLNDVKPPNMKDHPPSKREQGSNEWSIRINFDASAGAGISGSFATGELKNEKTGEKRVGFFSGLGIGISTKLSLPGASGWGEYAKFKTENDITFEEFSGVICRFTTASAGILFIGRSFSYISFPTLDLRGRIAPDGPNSISVGGWNMGQIGAGGSSTVGVWQFA